MIKNKKIYTIILMFIVFFTVLMLMSNKVFAEDTKEDRTSVTQFEGETSSLDNAATEIVNVILGTVQVVAGGVAVLSMLWIGIKYVTSAPDGRAEYMKKFAIFVLGLTIVIEAAEIVRNLAAL